jgi:hypothetical protein
MTEAEIAVAAAMGEEVPEPAKELAVSWNDFLIVCAERGIEFVEGKTVLQMKEDFLANLDKVEPDSEEENTLSDMLVNIQSALVDGAKIVGSPEDADPKKAKKPKKEKAEKVKKEKVPKEPKPKKEKVARAMKPKLGGVGMKPMCRNLFGEMNLEQVKEKEKEIKEKLSQVYVDAGLGDHAYGMIRAGRIYSDIFVEIFKASPNPKPVPVPKGAKLEKEDKEIKKAKKAKKAETVPTEEEGKDVPVAGEAEAAQ